MVGEKKHPYSICYWQWCLLDYWIYKFWGCFFVSRLSKCLSGFLTVSGVDWVLFRPFAVMYHRSITTGWFCHIFLLLPFLTENSCRKNLSQPSVQQNFLIKMMGFFFFDPNKIVKNKTFPAIHIFQFFHVCNNCSGNIIYSLIKTIWKVTSPNFTRETTSVGMGKPWWESQQWLWYNISQKLEDI